MGWQKAPEELKTAFDAALPDDPRVVRKQMFGYPCAVTGGNMFASVHEHRVVLRLDESGRTEIEALGATAFEPMVGRPMREYVVAPPDVVASPEQLRRWVARAFAYGLTLAPKEARAAKRSKTSR